MARNAGFGTSSKALSTVKRLAAQCVDRIDTIEQAHRAIVDDADAAFAVPIANLKKSHLAASTTDEKSFSPQPRFLASS